MPALHGRDSSLPPAANNVSRVGGDARLVATYIARLRVCFPLSLDPGGAIFVPVVPDIQPRKRKEGEVFLVTANMPSVLLHRG
jgi:hypothetical protein